MAILVSVGLEIGVVSIQSPLKVGTVVDFSEAIEAEFIHIVGFHESDGIDSGIVRDKECVKSMIDGLIIWFWVGIGMEA